MIRQLPIISIHLPKSGGTSVRVSLAEQFGERAFFDYGRGPLGPHRDLREEALKPGIDLVHGHFRPARYDAVGDAFRFTFMRRPTELLLSFYFFWRTMPHEGLALHRRFLDEQPTIEAFAAWDPIRRLTSDTFFGGYDMTRFDFIGFHETRHEDMARLNALANLRLDGGRHENATAGDSTERSELRNDARRMKALEDLLIDDTRFYERMRRQYGA